MPSQLILNESLDFPVYYKIVASMRNPSSGYYGVSYDRSRDRWVSYIFDVTQGAKRVICDCHFDSTSAAKMHDAYVIQNKIKGEPLNFE
jgi:hypothetical protein